MADEDTDFLSEIQEAVNNSGSDLDSTPTGDSVPDNTSTADRFNDIEQAVLKKMAVGDEEEEKVAPKKEEAPATNPTQQQRFSRTAEVEKKVETHGQAEPQEQRGRSPLDLFLKEDAKGNLTMEDGTVIALAGKSREIYERLKRDGREQRAQAAQLAVKLQGLGDQFQRLYNDYNDVKSGGGKTFAEAKNLTEKELDQAVALAQQYKTDPVAAIKSLLTQAQMSGIKLNSIGVDGVVDGATVTNVVRQQLQELLSPLLESNAQSETERKSVEAATKFLKDFPDAVPFVDLIDRAKTLYPDKSYAEIWAGLLPHIPEYKENQRQGNQPSTQQQPKDQRQVSRFIPPITQVVTQQTRQPAQKEREITEMSYDEIARQIAKEFGVP